MEGTSDRVTPSGKGARGRRRRPSGEPPPLPRPAWWRTTVIVLVATVVLGLMIGELYASQTP